MRRQTPIAHLLYSHLFPAPTSKDPPSFSAHLAQNLVPEVRIEVATFYGDLISTEARYPGLNYCYPPHRLRLGRFKHHRRLFDAFDDLGLTYGEIQDFCCWEGTKWARERYEKDEGIKVPDTTGDEIGPFVEWRDRTGPPPSPRRESITRKTDILVVVEDNAASRSNALTQTQDQEMSDAEFDVNEDEVATETQLEARARREHTLELSRRREQALNQRIIRALELGQPLSPDIEQYLKEQSERGTLEIGMDLRRLLESRRGSRHSPSSTSTQSTSRPSARVVPRAAA
ncbi:Hypothetical protein R9X50_00780700 [Acrodontium crateriforme]|uniref:Uncharacterized protein n=1 Tax=Acrodontium crateriforme TaxID=150365 RepID=A0AAQ3MBX0_9PEZI|nr:Hypothetical protein R9X50_00780700 [Acrodontium crateriforme]